MSNSRLARWCVCGMAIARPVASADVPAESSVGSICTVVVESDLLIVERNSDGAQRLTMNTQTYILQHDARYYLSKSQGSKTVVFDVTSYAIVREIDRSPLTSPTATATIRDYLELANTQKFLSQIADPSQLPLSGLRCGHFRLIYQHNGYDRQFYKKTNVNCSSHRS
jgi:hypothetical protein